MPIAFPIWFIGTAELSRLSYGWHVCSVVKGEVVLGTNTKPVMAQTVSRKLPHCWRILNSFYFANRTWSHVDQAELVSLASGMRNTNSAKVLNMAAWTHKKEVPWPIKIVQDPIVAFQTSLSKAVCRKTLWQYINQGMQSWNSFGAVLMYRGKSWPKLSATSLRNLPAMNPAPTSAFHFDAWQPNIPSQQALPPIPKNQTHGKHMPHFCVAFLQVVVSAALPNWIATHRKTPVHQRDVSLGPALWLNSGTSCSKNLDLPILQTVTNPAVGCSHLDFWSAQLRRSTLEINCDSDSQQKFF